LIVIIPGIFPQHVRLIFVNLISGCQLYANSDMADAPEVVLSSLSPEQLAAQSPQSSPSPVASPLPAGDDANTRADKTAKGYGLALPLNGHEHVEEKQAMNSDENAPKTALDKLPETEESNPKIGYEHDDKAGSGLEPFKRDTALRGGGDNDTATRTLVLDDDQETGQWHFSFWEFYKPGGLCT
jgi:hypothetical protein